MIDNTESDPHWWSHPIPKLYGFCSYVSLPVVVDGLFFGTLCALDDAPRERSLQNSLSEFETMARDSAALLAPNLRALAG